MRRGGEGRKEERKVQGKNEKEVKRKWKEKERRKGEIMKEKREYQNKKEKEGNRMNWIRTKGGRMKEKKGTGIDQRGGMGREVTLKP